MNPRPIGLCHMFPNGQPPVHHLHLRAWNQVLPAATSENLKPDLSREHTMNQQMIHDFRLLGAKRTRCVVAKAMAPQTPSDVQFLPRRTSQAKSGICLGLWLSTLPWRRGWRSAPRTWLCMPRPHCKPPKNPSAKPACLHLRVQDYLLQHLKTSTNCIITGMVLGPVTS
jgi:hypothetical protein